MANDQFSLCWENFHKNMSSGLSSLLKSEHLVDVTLAAEGRYLKAHKMILSVCSPYFKELFDVNPCQHPIVFLKDVSYNVLSNLLDFMYHGEVKVCQDELGNFIKTAEALKIKGLTGDSSTPAEPEPEPEPEPEVPAIPIQNNISVETPVPLSRKGTRERTPPPRKKMLGPASKRFKSDTGYNQSQQQSEQSASSQFNETPANNDTKNSVPLAPLTNLKVEPLEIPVPLSNEEEITYDDSAMDDMGMENNTTDYMTDNSVDVNAGTSTEVTNSEAPSENQVSDVPLFVRNNSCKLSLVYGKNVFYKVSTSSKGIKWRCAAHAKTKCQCYYMSPQNGKYVIKYREHNHPVNMQYLKKVLESPEIYTSYKGSRRQCLVTTEQRLEIIKYNLGLKNII